MDPRHPSAGGGRVPAVDERLVAPESRYEILDGRVEYVAPSDEPHGTRHSKVSALLECYAADDYDVACDMLTRTSETSDIAPDASVFPRERDPMTGGRRLEELAFEVVSTERLSVAAEKARKLVARGVRRVFAIDVQRRRALGWSRETDGWEILPADGTIEDRALALPLPLDTLVNAAKTDDAIARALLAKHNPVIDGAIRAERVRAKADSILAVLAARHIDVPPAEERRIRSTADEGRLDGLLRLAATCASLDKLFEE